MRTVKWSRIKAIISALPCKFSTSHHHHKAYLSKRTNQIYPYDDTHCLSEESGPLKQMKTSL